jgi:hypothetical protein
VERELADGGMDVAARLRQVLSETMDADELSVDVLTDSAGASAEDRCLAMCCTRCNGPIATAEDLLPAQIPRLESASYPYQLDLLGNEEAWVYSATNPSSTRFDVARFGPGAVARVRTSGDPTADHSFFPSYAWNMAACAQCGSHLGWAFSQERSAPSSEAEGDVNGGHGDAEATAVGTAGREGSSFVGLILTHLRERYCTPSELSRTRRAASRGSGSGAEGPPSVLELLRLLMQRAPQMGGTTAEDTPVERPASSRSGDVGDVGDVGDGGDDESDDEAEWEAGVGGAAAGQGGLEAWLEAGLEQEDDAALQDDQRDHDNAAVAEVRALPSLSLPVPVRVAAVPPYGRELDARDHPVPDHRDVDITTDS